MGRTIPTFRIALEMERRRWKPIRNVLGKKEKKKELFVSKRATTPKNIP
jgi:hypothetical protein